MLDLYINIKRRREGLGMSQQELADKVGYTSRSSIAKIEAGERDIPQSKIIAFASALQTTPAYLMGWEKESQHNNVVDIETCDTAQIRYLGVVAAHFGGTANEKYETLEVPLSWIRGRAEDYFAVSVSGDSMYPEYRAGDEVLCRFCDDMGRSGQVGVFMCPDGESTLKRINYVYGEDWVELEPINPEYAPRRIEGYELEQCKVVGKAIRLIRAIEK